MTNQETLTLYRNMMPFLAALIGPGCEIVLHDASNPECSILAIENNLSGRKPGGAFTDLAKAIKEQGAFSDESFLLNYSGKTKGKEFLSSTYFIKNNGQLIGMLCFNKDLTAAKELTAKLQILLERFNLTLPEKPAISENLENPVSNMLHSLVADAISQTGLSPSRMSREEKVRLVQELGGKGVLNMKGGVAELASQLEISEPTVYRYLKKL